MYKILLLIILLVSSNATEIKTKLFSFHNNTAYQIYNYDILHINDGLKFKLILEMIRL
jgi:hypothetical protein